ncbi:MAG: DUF4139 domain-containing protein [Candidatus Bipolaricaulia bacterium]
MTMRKLLLIIPLALVLFGLGAGSLGTEGEIELTVYSNDLALVNELRTITLQPGEAAVSLEGLPKRLIPSSVHLQALAGDISVLEQEFLYEPLSESALLKRFIGQEIEVRDRGNSYRGTLLSTDGGIILQERTGDLQIIEEPTGFTLSGLPAMAAEPRLDLLLSTDLWGEQEVQLSYLTRGLSWEASYTAVLNENRMALSGLVSIANSSGLSFKDAKLRLVAGEPHRVGGARPLGYAKMMAEAAPSPQFTEEAAFEYHLYTLQRPATIGDGRTKQLRFISAPDVQIERHYIYEGHVQDGVLIKVEFLNSRLNGLGQPLPAGIIRFYQEGLFIGEDRISHTPVDERVSLTVGKAFDLVGERTQVEHRRVAERKYRDTFLIVLKNHKEEDVTVEVLEHLQGDWTILRASQNYRKIDASTISFEIPVSAGGEAQISYTVEYQR